MRQLSESQKQAILLSRQQQQSEQAATQILLENINQMITKGETVVLTEEDIYPELWEQLTQRAISVIEEYSEKINDSIKNIVRGTKYNEALNPIVKKEDREVPPADLEGIFIYSCKFKMQESVKDRKDEIVAVIIDELLEVNECGMYEDIPLSLIDWIKDNDILQTSIDREYMTREDYETFLTDFIQAGGNMFVAIDIIFNIFEYPHDIRVALPELKYGYVENNPEVETVKEEIPEDEEKEEEVIYEAKYAIIDPED